MGRIAALRSLLLMLFVVLAAGAAVAGPEAGGGSSMDDGLAVEALPSGPDSLTATAASASEVSESEPVAIIPRCERVVLYYFHRTARCDNCLKFEAYTDSTLLASFESELSAGVLEWNVVNLDDEGNEGFIDRYALEETTLLSSVVTGCEEQSWRSLDAIWWLVDDRQAFAEYVAAEVMVDLDSACGKRAPGAAVDEGVWSKDSRREGD